MTVNFHQWECQIMFDTYKDALGRIAIILINAKPLEEDGYTMEPGTEVIAIATVNIPEIPIGENQVIIKNYSENEGIDKILREAGIISETTMWVRSGWVSVPVCNLLVDPKTFK